MCAKKVVCGCSLEQPQEVISNENPLSMFVAEMREREKKTFSPEIC